MAKATAALKSEVAEAAPVILEVSDSGAEPAYKN